MKQPESQVAQTTKYSTKTSLMRQYRLQTKINKFNEKPSCACEIQVSQAGVTTTHTTQDSVVLCKSGPGTLMVKIKLVNHDLLLYDILQFIWTLLRTTSVTMVTRMDRIRDG